MLRSVATNGAKVVIKAAVVPWWAIPFYKIFKNKVTMASVEPDGGGDRLVSINHLLPQTIAESIKMRLSLIDNEYNL